MLELCTIPKSLYKPYFDTLFLVKPDVELNIGNNQIYVSTKSSNDVAFISTIMKTTIHNEAIIKVALPNILNLTGKDPTEDIKFSISDNRLYIKVGKEIYTSLTLADPRVKTTPYPERIIHESSITLTNEDVQSIVKLIKKLSDPAEYIILTLTSESLTVALHMSSDDTAEIPYTGTITGPPCKVKLPFDHVLDILTHHKEFTAFKFSLNTDYPMRIDMSNSDNTIITTGLVSPRFEED